MDILSLTNLNLNPKIQLETVLRSGPWFGDYRYSISFVVQEASGLRQMNHTKIDQFVYNVRKWDSNQFKRRPGNRMSDDCAATLHLMCAFFLAQTARKKIVIAGSMIYVYTNDVTLIESICDLPWVVPSTTRVSTITLAGTAGAVTLKSPDHAWRTYFKNRYFTHAVGAAMRDFLQAQEGIRLSPALTKYWDQQKSPMFSLSYFFVDHDSPSTMSMLGLIAPGLVRKTVPIVADK
jgi:hypothetical protein